MSPTHQPLAADKLRQTVDAASLGFKTTAELAPASGLIGQDRALNAIELGANIKQRDFNIFAFGPASAGKSTAVKAYLKTKALAEAEPSEWVYVNNFDNPMKPRAIALPRGHSRSLERGMVRALDELRTLLPALLEGDDVQARRRAIEEAVRSEQEAAFEALSGTAQEQEIAVLRTPMGFALAPMQDGKVIKPEAFSSLDAAKRAQIETKLAALHKELESILEQVPKRERERRDRLRQLMEEVANVAVRQVLAELKSQFGELADVAEFLELAHRDLVRNVDVFLSAVNEDGNAIKAPIDSARDSRFRRWMINVLVVDGEPGAPIIEEPNPTHGNLMGRIEHIAQMGTLLTDFLLIKAGALHRANGGYLLIDARAVLTMPFAWEALKRALKSHELRVEPPSEIAGLMATQSLDPDPIPLSVKVVLFGDPMLYYLLNQYDPDFARLFKIQADFDSTITRSPQSEHAYGGLVASIVGEHKLRPVDASGVARMIEEGTRIAEDNRKLSIEIGRLADIVREADYYAATANSAVISREHVARAISESVRRADRMRERTQEAISRNIIVVETEGVRIGQVNGLSVLSLGNFAFGRPSRITARVRMGGGRVVDIEREVKLGGPLHSKGVMILWGFLAGRYALDVPLALAASLVFEQSYGGVDGDSASSAELYALLSALAEVPIKQSFAVTGSVDQLGVVQAIGGANEKIEGFFDVCSSRGLSGQQGVLIPSANIQHLVLREDVVAAVRVGKFQIYPVETIDQGLEILTGETAGVRGSDGKFDAGSLNARIEQRLRDFATKRKSFETEAAGGNGAGKETL